MAVQQRQTATEAIAVYGGDGYLRHEAHEADDFLHRTFLMPFSSSRPAVPEIVEIQTRRKGISRTRGENASDIVVILYIFKRSEDLE